MSKDAGAYYGYAGRSSSQRHLPPIRDVVGGESALGRTN